MKNSYDVVVVGTGNAALSDADKAADKAAFPVPTTTTSKEFFIIEMYLLYYF